MLRDGRLHQHTPTFHPSTCLSYRGDTDDTIASEELTLGSIRFKAYDLGGHETGAPLSPPTSLS